MTFDWVGGLEEAARGPIREAVAREFMDSASTDVLRELACHRRDRAWGRVLTYSPKVFLPVTNLCRNRCDYCAFRRSPGDEGEWTMSPTEIEEWLERGKSQGCIEALLCLGDTPEKGFKEYRALLKSWGFDDTVDYLYWIGQRALEKGLLPHTNAGILSKSQMQRLKEVNVSMGLMLENVSSRLCEPGQVHHKAPDKRPQTRVRMTEEAGELAIAFTSGMLIGIGETSSEQIDTLFEIRRIHRAHGHIQEVIVQNFRAHRDTRMQDAPEPSTWELCRVIALARLILDDDISVQAPPNLSAGELDLLIGSGINDFGGISPVTPDYINVEYPWPHIDRLRGHCAELGFSLSARLPIYGRAAQNPLSLHESVRPSVEATRLALRQLRIPSAQRAELR